MGRDYRSPEAEAYRALYRTAEWKRLRANQFRLHPLCYMCKQTGCVTAATVCDHHKAHKGDLDLFRDPTNLRSLCKAHHDGTKQRAEARGYEIGCDLTGKPRAADHPWNRA